VSQNPQSNDWSGKDKGKLRPSAAPNPKGHATTAPKLSEPWDLVVVPGASLASRRRGLDFPPVEIQRNRFCRPFGTVAGLGSGSTGLLAGLAATVATRLGQPFRSLREGCTAGHGALGVGGDAILACETPGYSLAVAERDALEAAKLRPPSETHPVCRAAHPVGTMEVYKDCCKPFAFLPQDVHNRTETVLQGLRGGLPFCMESQSPLGPLSCPRCHRAVLAMRLQRRVSHAVP
jgi:hypothetical protein